MDGSAKVAVVTGAARGLGKAISRSLVGEGFRVLMTDVDEAAVSAAASELGEGTWSVPQDVRDPESHRAVAREAATRGRVAAWVNNAGVLSCGPHWEMEEDDVRRHVDVNLLGVIWGSRAAIDAMGDGGGHLVNIASISAHTPAPTLAVYGATKHAVLGYSLSLLGDLRLAGRPIEVTAICPDAVATDMVLGVAENPSSSLLFHSELLQPEEVARAVVSALHRPQPMITIPGRRGALVHLARPFPKVVLGMLGVTRKAGERRRKKRMESAKP